MSNMMPSKSQQGQHVKDRKQKLDAYTPPKKSQSGTVSGQR